MLQYLRGALIIFTLVACCVSCKQAPCEMDGTQIAFMSDVHLSDIYAQLEDSDYRGVMNPSTKKHVIIRTMKSQLHSTRLFNENYFAFKAALDDVVKRKIKLVVLPGDFSDDGQPYNVKGLENLLKSYTNVHGIRFFAITGNHDPVAPFTNDAGKSDFLGEGGKPQAIMSREGLYNPQSQNENPVVVSKDVCELGYEQIVTILGKIGFLPQARDRYWATPFSTYDYENYSYDRALAQSTFNNRQYVADSLQYKYPDVSYLVEPVDGLWLLALDGNVYLPSGDGDHHGKRAKLKRGGEYANVIEHKKYLIQWVNHVVQESQRLGKTLVTFSHYPMVDFYDGAANDLESLFGAGKFQLSRVPDESVSKIFADAGIKLHFAGHLHFNDTGVRRFDNSFLVNVQVPSLAGYPAAYKILTIRNMGIMDVETVRLDSVPGFDELFSLYETEYAYLLGNKSNDLWDRSVLTSASYNDLVNWHLKELVRLRFLKNDWPSEFKDFLLNSNGSTLLEIVGGDTIDSEDYACWTGFDMIFDFYRILNGDQLAKKDIGLDRMNQYKTIIDAGLLGMKVSAGRMTDRLSADFYLFLKIFDKLLDGEPSDHFRIDMKSGQLKDMSFNKQ